MRKYTVYMHTNKINGKKYIGATSMPIYKRYANGSGYAHQTRFAADIRFYGWDSFTHEVLYTNLSRSRAERVEAALIAKYHTTDPKRGYNIQRGGGIPSAETRQKISVTLRERLPEHCYPKRQIYVPETGKVYDSLRAAADACGVSVALVCNDAHRKGGFHRFFYLDSLIPKAFRFVNWRCA